MKNRCVQYVATLLLLGPASYDFCLAQDVQSKPIYPSDPLSGVVVNQTITVNGQEFYKSFTAAWLDSEIGSRFVLTVIERPNARHGTHIWVEHQRNKVFETILSPSRAQIQSMGLQAAEAVQQAIVSADVERALYIDQDLAKDEI